jgi:hypothetical protein
LGEKIKSIGHIVVDGLGFEVELNYPPAPGLPQQIHIQSKNFRIELDEDEFFRLVCAVRLAKEKLKRLKQLQ